MSAPAHPPSSSVRRLCALAALFAPERAGALVSRLAAGAQGAAEEARWLVGAARRERLRALSEALELSRPAGRTAAEVGAGERARVRELLGAIELGTPVAGAHPVLVRVCAERLGGR
ncbi:MAG: hypothetical protein QM704_09765 [Anaeromyxobacteraceae bacterium]